MKTGFSTAKGGFTTGFTNPVCCRQGQQPHVPHLAPAACSHCDQEGDLSPGCLFFPFSLPPCRVFSSQAEQTPHPRGCSAEGRLMPTEGRASLPLPAAARFWSTSHRGGTAVSPGHGDALLRCTWATLLSL